MHSPSKIASEKSTMRHITTQSDQNSTKVFSYTIFHFIGTSNGKNGYSFNRNIPSMVHDHFKIWLTTIKQYSMCHSKFSYPWPLTSSSLFLGTKQNLFLPPKKPISSLLSSLIEFSPMDKLLLLDLTILTDVDNPFHPPMWSLLWSTYFTSLIFN